MDRIRCILTISVGLLAGLAVQSVDAAEHLLVLSKAEHTLAIVDPATLHVLARLPVGNDPHEVIASTDGKTAYVSNYGGGRYNTLAVLDLIARKPLPSVDLGALRGPHGLVYIDGKVWLTAEGAHAAARYDPGTKQVDWIFGTGQDRTHMIYVTPDAAHVVTTNITSATVSFIDRQPERGAGTPGPPPIPGGNWTQTLVKVGPGAEGFDVAPNGKELWTANARDGSISVIDCASRQVVQTIPAGVVSANRLKFTPDGRQVFVSALNLPEVYVFDAVTRKEFKRVAVGHGAAGMQMQPDGSRAYVSCTPDNYVAVLDLKTLSIVGRIDAGPNPDGLAWAVEK